MFFSQTIIETFEKKYQQKLQKLRINDLLSLVLLHPPKSYTHTILLKSLPTHLESCTGVVRVIITEIQNTHFNKNAPLRICAQMLYFKNNLQLIIFHPKAFHKKIFAPDSHIYVMGKLEYKNGQYTMIQPKITQDINTIKLHFKTTLLGSNTMQELTQNLITHANLIACGLPSEIAQKIEKIFCPDTLFLQIYAAHSNALPKEYLDALKFVEIYQYLRNLSRKKRYFYANFACKGNAQNFIDSLPFKLTKGQFQAIKNIQQDLASNKSSRRLIMGDVGCGKTIVILCAVMIAYPYKSILMAPTTILAKQLYEEAKHLLPAYVNLELITAQNKSAKDSLFNKETHFIIGTQALLYRDFQFDDVALVMSDEQHRFGTIQRYKLEKAFYSQNLHLSDNTESSKKRPHTLQFSATPIPRTLAMLNSGLIDFSFIRDLPFKKEILTRIIGKKDFSSLLTHMKNEIAQQHQIIIVYPLVEESESIDYLSLSEGFSFWQKHFEGVYITSGKDKEKQNVVDEFREKGSILLATTVIEVGISLPKVSTIVVVAPERLGLATLHQLRGRVSRNGLKGYCYLYTHSQNLERLKAFASTLNGFDIAELDLKYRNSGDLLSGNRQSGDGFLYIDLANDENLIKQAQTLLTFQN